jgi:hypothetical protein
MILEQLNNYFNTPILFWSTPIVIALFLEIAKRVQNLFRKK